MPDERIITGTLENIIGKDVKSPALVIVGNVVDLFKRIPFMKSFKSKLIALTRPLERSDEAVKIIEDYMGKH